MPQSFMASDLIINNKIENDKFIKEAPFKKDIGNTLPHKHNNYFEIIYLPHGNTEKKTAGTNVWSTDIRSGIPQQRLSGVTLTEQQLC